MRRLLSLVALTGALSAPLAAQEAPSLDPAVPPALVRTGPSAEDRVTIPIHIGGKGPWNFIIDTGSQRTVISRDLAARLALPVRNPVIVLSMTDRLVTGTVALPELGFGNSQVRDIEAPVLDGGHLGAPGLLGLDSLQTKRLLLDFRTGRMEISESRSRYSRDPDTIVVEARRKNGQLILLDSDVNGMKVNIVLDTGTNFSVANMALMNRLIRKKRAPLLEEATLTSVTGGTLVGRVGKIREVRLGQVKLRELPVLFADASPFAELGLADKPALLLGINALKGFDRVAIDFGRGKVDFLLPDMGFLERTRFAAAAMPAG
ncbi:MAG: retroviral-like aspartic protease family protein [Sphingobium sp.]